MLPAPLDHVLLQADLTAVAPGPLEGELAREMSLLADVESTGGATVYRFSESSLRRALDAGRSATDVLATLGTRSRTPVPQPLEYLVLDVARRHGALRVGLASAYLRCDDPTTLSEVLADRRLATLRLVRLADTVDRVAVTGRHRARPAARRRLLAERGELRRRGRRSGAPTSDAPPAKPRPPRLSVEPPAPTEALLSAAVRALRAGETAAANRPPAMPEGNGSGRLPRSSTSGR